MSRGLRRFALLSLMFAPLSVRAADEFSGADKLRALYAHEFRFTKDGVPVVPVAIAQGMREVTISATDTAGLRLLPEGEGGPEVRADEGYRIRAFETTPATLRTWVIVWRGAIGQGAEAAAVAQAWKGRGERSRVFEQGTLFGVSGEVLDRRELLVVVAPSANRASAEREAERVARKAPPAATGFFTELVERPRGMLEAVGTRAGTRVRNEGMLWFASAGDGPVRVEATGDRTKVDGTFYGRVYATVDRNGALAVVNAVPEDKLLAGLVPAETFPGAPDEALKAQAVAARGELLAKIGTRHHGDPFRLCNEVHCQVYAGAGRETPRATAAVTATRGQVMFSPERRDLIDAFYAANCGGHSEHNENVWPDTRPMSWLRGHRDAPAVAGDPYASGVTESNLQRFLEQPPNSYCANSKLAAADRHRWTVTRTAAELRDLLRPLGVGEVRAIQVLERGVSGRARAVRITGTRREEIVRGELRIRQTFGGLRSSLFLVDVKDGAATFRGAGHGHGVGMCQTGAMGMADAGKSYREILQHYYPGSVLRKLW